MKRRRVKSMGDEARYFDTSDLSGDNAPKSLAYIIRVNDGDDNMDPSELRMLRTCKIGRSVPIGIGGGFVTFKRVKAPRTKRGRK